MVGFDVYRDAVGGRVRLNRTPIWAAGWFGGRGYVYRDARPLRRTTRYWLEERRLDGTSAWLGPVSVAAP